MVEQGPIDQTERKKYEQWKQEWVDQEEYRDVVQKCRDQIRKAKLQMELNMVKNMKNNKKGSFRHIGQSRQKKENVLLL